MKGGMLRRCQNGGRAISAARLRALVVAVLGLLLTAPAWADRPMPAILSGRPDAVVHVDGKLLGAVPPMAVGSAACGGGVVRLPDWKWHKIDVFLDGIRASGPAIVQASSNQIYSAVLRFALDNDVAGLNSLRTEGLPIIGETQDRASIPVVESDILGKHDSGPRVHAADSVHPADPVTPRPSAPKLAADAETRTGTVNVGIPQEAGARDVVRFVEIATGETVAWHILKGNDLTVRFADILGMRLYKAELVRDGNVIGASTPLVLGKNGIWTPFQTIRIEPTRETAAPKVLETVAGAASPAPEGSANLTVEIVCPEAGKFDAICQELRTQLDRRGVRWACAIEDDEIDAYLSAYGFSEGGPALRGEQEARRDGRPVVNAGKRYVFFFRDFKLARNINAEQAFPGDVP